MSYSVQIGYTANWDDNREYVVSNKSGDRWHPSLAKAITNAELGAGVPLKWVATTATVPLVVGIPPHAIRRLDNMAKVTSLLSAQL